MAEAIRVLVVEDEGIVAMDLISTLQRLGYDVAGQTGRAENAVQLATNGKADVVLMDIRLAGKMDGIEAAKRVRAELGLPVIFLTSHTDDATLARAKEAEPYGYITKPFDENSLRTNLELVHYRRASELAREMAATEAARVQRVTLENRMLQEVSDMRARFISTASHELNTPLTPIRINIDLLSTMLHGRLDEKEAQLFGSLDRNFSRLAALVKDLLESARLQSGRLAIAPTQVDLGEIVASVARTFDGRAAQGGYEFQVDAEPCAARADAERIAQVVAKLLDNAFKFTPHRGRISVKIRNTGQAVTVSVQDSGRGMEPDQLGVLFQPFSLLHQEENPVGQGTGLGLYIARGLAELHGGRLKAASEGRGKGSKFTLELPNHQVANLGKGAPNLSGGIKQGVEGEEASLSTAAH